MSFPKDLGSHLGHYIAFSRYVFLNSFLLGQFLRFFSFWWPCLFLRITYYSGISNAGVKLGVTVSPTSFEKILSFWSMNPLADVMFEWMLSTAHWFLPSLSSDAGPPLQTPVPPAMPPCFPHPSALPRGCLLDPKVVLSQWLVVEWGPRRWDAVF